MAGAPSRPALQGKDVVSIQEKLTGLYPASAIICSDKVPEFTAHALRSWCTSNVASCSVSAGCSADKKV